MDVLGKISVATVGTKPKRAHPDVDNIKTPLMRVMGTARGLKQAVDTNGEPTFGLTGSFLATNIADGKEFTSGVLYLPGGIQELIQDPLEALMNSDDERTAKNAAIEFAMDLFAVPATNKAGYSFVGTLLGDAAEADPFAALKLRIAAAGVDKLPALPTAKEIEAAKKTAA